MRINFNTLNELKIAKNVNQEFWQFNLKIFKKFPLSNFFKNLKIKQIFCFAVIANFSTLSYLFIFRKTLDVEQERNNNRFFARIIYLLHKLSRIATVNYLCDFTEKLIRFATTLLKFFSRQNNPHYCVFHMFLKSIFYYSQIFWRTSRSQNFPHVPIKLYRQTESMKILISFWPLPMLTVMIRSFDDALERKTGSAGKFGSDHQ